MTKKHFIAFADMLKEIKEDLPADKFKDIKKKMIIIFKQSNSQFNVKRFNDYISQ